MNIKKAYSFKEVDEQVSCSGTLIKVNRQSLSEEGYEVVINLLQYGNYPNIPFGISLYRHI